MFIAPYLFALTLQGPAQPPQAAPGSQRAQQSQTRPQTTEPGSNNPGSSPMVEIPTVVTQHTMGALSYTATAAQIPLRNENNEVECRMFYVAYLKGNDMGSMTPLGGRSAPQGDAKRPVTFAFNGGPGSATIWLHMGALGPKRAPMNDDGTLPNPPFAAVDNAESWLDFTDVVVIDAPGTGWSRIARPDLASKYFGVQPDIQAFTQFIRNWLTEHHRWTSPLFVAGESYGGIRGSGLSASLFRSGIDLSGFISISGTSNFMTLDGMRGNDATFISFLPSMAACAWYHHKAGARYKSVDQIVNDAREFVDKDYAAALQRGDSMSPAEKERIAARMSELIGLSKDYILGLNLRVPEFNFFTELLRSQRLQLGRYDGRLVGQNELTYGAMGRQQGGPGDPSDDATTGPFTASLNGYLDEELKVRTTMPYLNSGNVRPWTEPEGSYAETASDLRNVLARNKHFKVLYCMGYYDLACPLNGTIYTVNHMGLDPDARARVGFAYYPAGHMMYIEKSSRIKLHDDVKKFEAECLAGK